MKKQEQRGKIPPRKGLSRERRRGRNSSRLRRIQSSRERGKERQRRKRERPRERKSGTVRRRHRLEKQKFYHGIVPRSEESELMLDQGDWLVRATQTRKGGRSFIYLCVRWNGLVRHYKIFYENISCRRGELGAASSTSLRCFLHRDCPHFNNAVELVKHYAARGLPNGTTRPVLSLANHSGQPFKMLNFNVSVPRNRVAPHDSEAEAHDPQWAHDPQCYPWSFYMWCAILCCDILWCVCVILWCVLCVCAIRWCVCDILWCICDILCCVSGVLCPLSEHGNTHTTHQNPLKHGNTHTTHQNPFCVVFLVFWC
ncbi:MAG: hypothetical protein GY820_03250, partial [Gammaproteobacteria bacterium]|nr:hypothetical protein [Gammaproteobacteria bacterium]